MVTTITDLGSIERVANKLVAGAGTAHPRVMRAAWVQIHNDMMRAERMVFRSQGRRGGGSWKRLKTDTIAKKGSSRILYTKGSREGYSDPDNDALYKSVSFLNAPYQIWNVVGYTVEFGTERSFAASHQYGNPAKNIPKRPFLRFTHFDLDRWKLILLDHVMRPWRVKVTKANISL